jgi:hypothetical protein
MLDDNLGRVNGKAGSTFDFLVLDISGNKPLHSIQGNAISRMTNFEGARSCVPFLAFYHFPLNVLC